MALYIAINDTYGPEGPTTSGYITGARRTHAAVSIADIELFIDRARRSYAPYHSVDNQGNSTPAQVPDRFA